MGQRLDYYYVDCVCNDPDHTIRFVFDEDDGRVWVDVQLRSCKEFTERVKTAAKYLWDQTTSKHQSLYAALNTEQLVGLRALIDAAITRRQEGPPSDPDNSNAA
jgi:hypothetical protein